MKASFRWLCIEVTLIILGTLLILIGAQPAYAESEPVRSTVADKLIIQLGDEWAGAQFSLITDMGQYPDPIRVSDTGVLTMELSNSHTYTLRLLKTATTASLEGPVATPETSIQPVSTSMQTKPLTSPSPSETADAPAALPVDGRSGIPTMHIILFAGGLILCAGALLFLWLAKRRSYHNEDDEDAY